MIFTPEEKYGFRWGPLVVQRCCSDERIGYILQIETDAGRCLEVRVTPKGTLIETKVLK